MKNRHIPFKYSMENSFPFKTWTWQLLYRYVFVMTFLLMKLCQSYSCLVLNLPELFWTLKMSVQRKKIMFVMKENLTNQVLWMSTLTRNSYLLFLCIHFTCLYIIIVSPDSTLRYNFISEELTLRDKFISEDLTLRDKFISWNLTPRLDIER